MAPSSLVTALSEASTGSSDAVAVASVASLDPRRRVLGAVALTAATLSRYDAWPVAAGFAALSAWDARRAVGRDRARLLFAAGFAAFGPLAWIAWNQAAHGDAFVFIARVAAYKQALGGSDPGALARVLEYPSAALGQEPELFGLVAVGQMQTRRVTCRNTGNVPLLISSAGLSAGTTSDLTLAVTVGGASIALPNTIAANASVDLDLRFNPSMPASHMTTLTIASNDPDSPSTAITVSADAIAAGNCTVSIAPLTLDFGAVSPGSSVVARTRVTNTGAGSCAVNVVGLTAGGSPAFSLVSGPSSNVLNPAEVLFVDVRFAPATTGVVNATLELQTSDGARPSPTVALTGNGVSLAGSLVIVPDHLDFGAVPSACATGNSKRFDIYNTSGAPLSLTAVAMEMGSDPGFIVTAGALPVAIPVGGSAPVTVTFAPASAAAFIGRVRLSVAGLPAVFVPVSGRGGSAGTVTETFPASPAALVDVLLMVDDSGSMQPYQTLLANSIGAFIARGDAANADYHITVVTTDASTGIVGTMRGNPAVIDRSRANRVSELQANVQVGTAGAADEQAFRASAVAVTDTVLLAGGNAGFLRPNANLVVVILSDEDDQSPAGTALYVDQLRNRPVGAPSVTIYALSGGPEGCSGPNGSVVDAPRYDEAVTMSGGFHASICDSSFGASMTRIADATFGVGRQRYPLGVQPAPGSVVVRVDGVVRPATTGTITQYGIDYRAPAVQFAPGRAPSTTRAVSIAYTPFCVGATCGNGAPNSGEQCDDGNPSNADICPTTCYSAVCGDGFLRSTGEQCDDGNTIAGDGCNGVCTVEGCGNGVVEPPEVCDSGMNNSDTRANACRTTCVAAFCGDGVGDMGEACDDGNPFDTDACLTGCRAARCGDGAVRTGVEQCDDGNASDTDDCRNNCTFNGTGFTITRVNAAFVASPGAALTFAPSNDDGAATVPIGFPFTFLGGAVTNAYVGTNGLVGFTASDTAYQNTPIPDVDTPNGFIALWWDDLRVDLAATPVPTVTSTLTGRTPNRTRIVTYRDVPRYSATPSANNPTISMEIRLHETTNVIDVFYGPLGGGAGNPFSATVGWESPTGGRGADALGCGESCTSVQWPAGSRITYTP